MFTTGFLITDLFGLLLFLKNAEFKAVYSEQVMLLQEFIEQWMEKQCNGRDNNHLKNKKKWIVDEYNDK